MSPREGITNRLTNRLNQETDQVNVFLLGRNHVEMYKIMMSVAEIRGSSLDVQKFNESCFEQYL